MIYSFWEELARRGKMPHRGDENQILDFRPENGFTIEKLAEMIVQAMQDMDMDAQITLPGKVVLEIERECTEEEIIEGYNTFKATQAKAWRASNRNEKEPAK
jgi:hypothetical protein